MFVIKLTYKKSIDLIDKLRPAHLEFLDKYYAKEVFIASGRQNPLIGGVIIAICKSRDEIETILKEDPFHKEGVADYEITEFNANKFHPNLKDLLNK
jgi:uncharacterized protein YciI